MDNGQIISSTPLTPVQQEQAENMVLGWATLYMTTTSIIWGTQYQPVENQPPFAVQPKDHLTVKHFQRVLLLSVPECVVCVWDTLGTLCEEYTHRGPCSLVSTLRTLLLPPDPHAWFPSCGNGGSGIAVRTDAHTNLSPNHIVQICLGVLLHAPI